MIPGLLSRSLRLAALVLLGLALAPPVALLRSRGHDQAIVRWWMRELARALGLRIRVRGALPRRPALWCSNHVSWLDIVVLGAIADVGFVSKAEVRAWPLVGWLARSAGTLFIRRGAGQGERVSALIAKRLNQGRSVAIFPEGTTSDGMGVQRLYPRLFAAAIQAGAPLQPVALRFGEGGMASPRAPFVGDDTFLAHLIRILRLRDGLDVDIRLMPPIESKGLDRRSLAQAVRVIIQSGLDEITGRRIDIGYLPLPMDTGRPPAKGRDALVTEANS